MMIDRTNPLPVGKQAKLLGISRGAKAHGDIRKLESGRLLLRWPGAVGGFILFQQAGTAMPAPG